MSTSSYQNAKSENSVTGAAAGFGLAAAIAILFNTVLAWVKDAYEPLNTAMAHLTGHHWRTHGIFDLIVFFGLGILFTSSGYSSQGNRMAALIAGSVIVAGGGLALWFVLV